MSSLISLSSIKSKKWYRQQTEGTPYFIYLPCRGVIDYFRSRDKIIWFCSLDEARGYLEQGYVRQLAEKHLIAEKKQPGHSRKMFAGWQRVIQDKNQDLFRRIDRLNFRTASDRQLLSLNHSLGRQAYNMWLQFFMDIYDVDAESLIERELIKEGKTLSADEKNVLTLSPRRLVNQTQELELLKIARSVKADSECGYLLSRIQSADNIHRLQLQPWLSRQVESYLREFHWVRNSWAHVNTLSAFDVVEQVKQIAASSRDIKAEIKQLEHYKKDLAKKKKVISRKHHLSSWLIRMFDMFSLLALWRDGRKEQMQQLHYYLQLVGVEIARRSHLSWDKFKVIDPFSVKSVPVKAKELERCYRLHRDSKLLYWEGAIKHFSKDTSRKFEKALEDTFATEVTEVRGFIACPGKVKGGVVVINKKSEFGKMAPGKVLVTNMTRPDFLPLMKIAAAIVTDEGGITSHAAIISRELKIPCIIGTQVGTKVLKDGYQVEVNANHGVVLVL